VVVTVVVVTVVGVLAMAASVAALASAPTAAASSASAYPVRALVAFRSHFGFGRSHSRGYGFGGVGRRTSRHPLLRRVVKTAIWLYIAHLFFNHGGLSILLSIVIIGLVVSLLRRRRRHYAY
jgi:hypothetical protein